MRYDCCRSNHRCIWRITQSSTVLWCQVPPHNCSWLLFTVYAHQRSRQSLIAWIQGQPCRRWFLQMQIWSLDIYRNGYWTYCLASKQNTHSPTSTSGSSTCYPDKMDCSLAFVRLLPLLSDLIILANKDLAMSPQELTANGVMITGDRAAQARARRMISIIKNPVFWQTITL